MKAVRGEVTCPAYTARNGWTQDSWPGSLAPRPVLGMSLCPGRSDFPGLFWLVRGVVAGAEAGPPPESPLRDPDPRQSSGELLVWFKTTPGIWPRNDPGSCLPGKMRSSYFLSVLIAGSKGTGSTVLTGVC